MLIKKISPFQFNKILKLFSNNNINSTQYNKQSPSTLLSSTNKYQFSSSSTSYSNSPSPKQQFNKHFLIRIQYKSQHDAYYQTYPQRQQFRKQIKNLQDSNQCYIFGGDQFPLQSTQFVVNCDEKSFIENFLNKNAYSEKNLIEKYEIEQVEKISQQKMKKLSYFYQYL